MFLSGRGHYGSSTTASITSIEQISPELAAMIVKNYILPMFESDGKKSLKNKYNKMAGIADKNRDLGQNKSVYGELKLSEKLSNEL
jgi:hypothetical protein